MKHHPWSRYIFILYIYIYNDNNNNLYNYYNLIIIIIYNNNNNNKNIYIYLYYVIYLYYIFIRYISEIENSVLHKITLFLSRVWTYLKWVLLLNPIYRLSLYQLIVFVQTLDEKYFVIAGLPKWHYLMKKCQKKMRKLWNNFL